MKDPTFAPFYSCYLIPMTEVAREHGYALSVHGSMTRDMDLVAVPWVDGASSPDELISAIAKRTHTRTIDGDPEQKPHGRLAWSLPLGGGQFFDISVMPRRQVK